MATLPLSFFNPAVVNTLIVARNGHGAHSYYRSGWRMSSAPDKKLITPGWLEENGSFTAVFQHAGNTTSTASLIFGRHNKEDGNHVAITVGIDLTCEVRENGNVQTSKAENLNGISMVGLHVWRFEHKASGLEVFIDGQRCVKEGSIKVYKKEYVVLKGHPYKKDSPLIVWETHQILPDITNQFNPRYRYLHQGMKLGIGSSVEFYGKWDKPPKIWIHETNNVSNAAKTDHPPGEQIVTLKVFVDQFLMVSSVNNKRYFRKGVPVSATVEITRPGKPLYNITYVFAEIVY